MCSSKILNPASMLPGGKDPWVNPTALITNSSNRFVNPAGSLLAPKKSAPASTSSSPVTPARETSILSQASSGGSLLGG